MSTSSHGEHTSVHCLEAMVRKLHELHGELAGALEQILDVDDGCAEEVGAIEGRIAGLVVGVHEAREELFTEAQQQERDPRELDAIHARCFGTGPLAELKLSRESSARVLNATRWHRAADAGRADAQFVLGYALLGGLGHEPDEMEAAKRLGSAAEQGHPAALFELAGLFHEGRGVPRNPERAMQLLRKAADAGSNAARYTLAGAHLTGSGIAVDTDRALSLFASAAEDGHGESQLEIGWNCATGQIGEIDHAAAVKWLTLAAAQHRFAAVDWLDKYRRLSPAQYRSKTWLEAWEPGSQPPPGRSGIVGILVSLGLLSLLIVASLKGNSLGLFLLFLFVTVLAHEAGHLLAGRLVGIPTRVFCAGIGPLLRSFTRAGARLPTRYDLRLLPLLGYVEAYAVPPSVWDYWQACFGAADTNEAPPPLPEFDTKEPPVSVAKLVSRPRRLVYYLGGPFVNFVLAVVCLWGYENYTDSGRAITSPVAGRVPAGSVAEATGLCEGDRFLSIDGQDVTRGFFEVRDHLAPVDRNGVAGDVEDPPGAKLRLQIRRSDRELTLQWVTSANLPKQDAEERYGLIPPESWRIDGVRESVAERLQADDTITAFEGSGRRMSTGDPGAHDAIRRLFASGEGNAVTLIVQRPGESGERSVTVEPLCVVADSGGGERRYEPPFELARLRERGPPTSLGRVLARVADFGVRIVKDLPQDVLASVAASPTEAEKGRFLKAVKRDPWNALRMFALVNMILLFFNLLPIPPLDGFHTACCVCEMAIRRDLPARGVSIMMRLGWLLLVAWLLLNVFLMLRDLVGTVL